MRKFDDGGAVVAVSISAPIGNKRESYDLLPLAIHVVSLAEDVEEWAAVLRPENPLLFFNIRPELPH